MTSDGLPDLHLDQPDDKAGSDELAKKEQKIFSSPIKPNTIIIPLWKSGHVSFNPDSSVHIFAVIALVIIMTGLVILSIIGPFLSASLKWLEIIMTAGGHAITAIVGALIGATIKPK